MIRARFLFVWILACVLGMACLEDTVAAAQGAGGEVQYETREIADDVYMFQYGTGQSMFVVTPDGVIVMDPISVAASKILFEEIRKVTSAPVVYMIYSHHHLDHTKGGAPFKAQGATFIAHRQAKAALVRLNAPDVVVPDVVVDDDGSVLTLGGTRFELHYVGRNHTDGSLVAYLPGERIIYAVDFLPIREPPFRNLYDSYLLEFMESIDRVLELDWDRMVAGHSRQGGIGTRDDVRAMKNYMTELFELVREANAAGKCFEDAMAEIKMPAAYANWTRKEYLPGNIERMCYFFRNGWQ